MLPRVHPPNDKVLRQGSGYTRESGPNRFALLWQPHICEPQIHPDQKGQAAPGKEYGRRPPFSQEAARRFPF